MIITMEPTEFRGPQHAVAVARGDDDLNIWEVADLLRYMLMAYGFHPENVESVFSEFSEEANNG